MSRQNIVLFFQEVSQNPDILKKLRKIAEAYVNQTLTPEENDLLIQDVLLPVAKDAGYEFTLEELKDYSKEMVDELSDYELNTVAGGVMTGVGNHPVYTWLNAVIEKNKIK